MKLLTLVTAGMVTLSLAAGSALAQGDTASKQAEIRKATQATLQKFFAADPKLKTAVAKSPGFGVFTTYGFSFLIGGAGGHGLVHDNATKKDTFMSMAQASAGLQVGASQSESLIIFKTAKAMNDFITNGWEVGGGASASAGAGSKSAGQGAGENVIADAAYYSLTKNGLEAGVAAAGTKYWKNSDLN